MMALPCCPHCGAELPQYPNLPRSAQPGQLVLCIACEGIAVVAQDFSLRVPTAHEAACFAVDPGVAAVLATLRAIKAAALSFDDARACPGCGVSLRGSIDGDGMPADPDPGDMLVCPRCGCMSLYTSGPAGPFLRPLTDAERTRLLELLRWRLR